MDGPDRSHLADDSLANLAENPQSQAQVATEPLGRGHGLERNSVAYDHLHSCGQNNPFRLYTAKRLADAVGEVVEDQADASKQEGEHEVRGKKRSPPARKVLSSKGLSDILGKKGS